MTDEAKRETTIMPNETVNSENPVVTLICKMIENLSEGLDDVRRKERWVVREFAEVVAKIVERDLHRQGWWP